MLELTTTGRLVEYEALEDRSELAAVLARKEIEAAVESGQPAQLWLELGAGADDADAARVAIDLQPADLADLLRRAGGSDVAFVFDEDELAALLEEPDVEAHGLRAALAVAATSAAVLAPAGLAATPQALSPAATTQGVSPALTSQALPAATSQLSPAVESQAVRSQVVKGQVSKRLVLRGHGLTLVRGGLVR